MSRSADPRVRRSVSAVLVAGTLNVVMIAGTANAETNEPAPGAAVIDGAADVVGITAPVIDILTSTSSLDNAITDIQGTDKRTLVLAGDVFFAFDKDSLSGAGRARVREVAEKLREASAAAVRVDGHTDAKGSTARNAQLSRARAATVARELRSLVPGLRTTVVGHGARRPVAPNTVDGEDNPKGRALNRRVEVAVAS